MVFGKSSVRPRSEFSVVVVASLGGACCHTDLTNSLSGSRELDDCQGGVTLTGGVNNTELFGVGDCVC